MRARHGGTAVEFALILPMFVFLVSGLIDFGWLFFQQSALDSSMSVGCRAGALVDPGLDEANLATVEETAEEAMLAALDATGATCDDDNCITDVSTFGTSPGRSLLCQVTRDFTPLIGIVVSERELRANAAVRLEWQRG